MARTGRLRNQNITLATGKYLGEPNPQRAAKGQDFDRQELPGGRVVSEAKSLFTTAEQLDRALKDLRDGSHGTIEGAIRLRQTGIDRALSGVEHDALNWLVKMLALSDSGRPTALNYSGASSGGNSFNKIGFQASKQNDLEELAYVMKKMPASYEEFLDFVVDHQYPGTRSTSDSAPLSKIDMGKFLTGSMDKRRAEGGVEGYIKAVAQYISYYRMEYATIKRRERDLVKELVEKRKKMCNI